jgi:hypothetical protein
MEYLNDKQPFKEIMYFQDNQLLTAEQLNGVLKYLNREGRITRARLQGAGVVNGFHFYPEGEINNDLAVVLTPGTAVTGDGDLISFAEKRTYPWAIPFENGKDNTPAYEPFKQLLEQQGVVMYELLTAEVTGAVPLLKVLDQLHEGPDDRLVLMLYVHQFEEQRDICDPEDCDCKGSAEVSRVKLILVSHSAYVNTLGKHINEAQRFFNIPTCYVKRVLLDDKTVTAAAFIDYHRNVIEESVTDIVNSLDALDIYMVRIYEGISADVKARIRIFDRVRDNLGDVGSYFKRAVESEFDRTGGRNLQYFHAFLCDMADACNELRDYLQEHFRDRFLSPPVYPKHVTIGSDKVESDDYFTFLQYRHYYRENDAMDYSDEKIFRLFSLYVRIENMIQYYDSAAATDPTRRNVFIVPSNIPAGALGEKAMPVYYNEELLPWWNPHKRLLHPGYQPNTYWLAASGKHNALKHNIESYNFFRIEGHIGRTYEDAYKRIEDIRIEYDLPFDILGLQLETNVKTVIPTKDIKLGNLDILHDFSKLQVNDFLHKMEGFNTTLSEKVPTAVTELKAKGVNAEFIKQYKPVDTIADEITEARTELTAQISNLKALVNTPKASGIKPAEINLVHDTILDKAKSLSTNSRLLLRNDLVTPLQNFSYFFNPAQFEWLNGYNTLVEEAAKDLYVFTNFMKVNPGLAHGGGVSKGGTFILLYFMEGNVRRVIGDLYVPYYVEMQPAKVDTTKINADIRFKIPDFAIKPDIVRPAPGVNPDIVNIKNILDKNELTVTSDIKTRINQVATTEFNTFKSQVLDTYNNNFNNVFNSFAGVKTLSDGGLLKPVTEFSGLGALAAKDTFDMKADIQPVTEMLAKELEVLREADAVAHDALVTKLAGVEKLDAITKADDTIISNMTLLDKADTVNTLTQTLDTIKLENPTLHTTLMNKINIMTRFNK